MEVFNNGLVVNKDMTIMKSLTVGIGIDIQDSYCLCVEGDLVVDKQLMLRAGSKLDVKGNLIVKGSIFLTSNYSIKVAGDMIVEGMVASSFKNLTSESSLLVIGNVTINSSSSLANCKACIHGSLRMDAHSVLKSNTTLVVTGDVIVIRNGYREIDGGIDICKNSSIQVTGSVKSEYLWAHDNCNVCIKGDVTVVTLYLGDSGNGEFGGNITITESLYQPDKIGNVSIGHSKMVVDGCISSPELVFYGNGELTVKSVNGGKNKFGKVVNNGYGDSSLLVNGDLLIGSIQGIELNRKDNMNLLVIKGKVKP